MVIDVYAAMSDGVWLYEPKTHTLIPHMGTDIRSQTGTQDFVASAPLNLIYVAHGGRMHEVNAEERRLYASVDAAFIGQVAAARSGGGCTMSNQTTFTPSIRRRIGGCR
jgi:hypothetical protein